MRSHRGLSSSYADSSTDAGERVLFLALYLPPLVGFRGRERSLTSEHRKRQASGIHAVPGAFFVAPALARTVTFLEARP